MKIVILLCILLMIAEHFCWRITVKALKLHMQDKKCSLPDNKELEDCVRRAIKDVIHLKT